MKRYKFFALVALFASSMLLTSCEFLFEEDNPVKPVNNTTTSVIEGSSIGLDTSTSQPQSNAQ